MSHASPEQTQTPTPSHARVSVALLVSGLLVCALAATISFPRGSQETAWVGPLVRSYTLMWACYLAAAVVVTRARWRPRWTLAWIVGVTALLHVIIYLNPTPLSTDSFRYLWDGRLVAHGLNPYQYPPEAPELTFLRDDNYPRMEFRNTYTIYPPAAQGVFGLLAWVRGTDRAAFFWTFIAFNLGVTLLLIPLLRRTGRPAEQVIWYAWNPLAIVETAAGGHLDSVGIFFLMLALLLLLRRGAGHRVASAVAYAAAVLCKGPAVLVLPCFAWRGKGRFLAVFALLCGLAFIPFLGAGARIFAGLQYYFAYWETNSSLTYLVRVLYEWIIGVPAANRTAVVIAHDLAVARATTGAMLLLFMAWVLWRRRADDEWLLGSVFALLAAHLLLGAPVFPWYVMWSLPLLCLWRVPGWIAFSLTVFVQYYARYVVPEPYQWVPVLFGYLPVYGLLLWQWNRWRKASPTTTAVATG